MLNVYHTDKVFELYSGFKLLLDSFEFFLEFTFVSIIFVEAEEFLEISFRKVAYLMLVGSGVIPVFAVIAPSKHMVISLILTTLICLRCTSSFFM